MKSATNQFKQIPYQTFSVSSQQPGTSVELLLQRSLKRQQPQDEVYARAEVEGCWESQRYGAQFPQELTIRLEHRTRIEHVTVWPK